MAGKMIKRGLIGAGLGTLALGLLFGPSAPSYVKTAFHKVRHSAKGAVPVQFEIDRALQEVEALEPAIQQNIENLARAQVDVEYLNKEIASTRENLGQEVKTMTALKDSLKTGATQLTSGGVTYTADDVKRDLARRVDHCRQIKRILQEKEETLKLRRDAVRSAQKQLAAMAEQKRALKTRVEGIQARLAQVQAAQASNEFTFDDSALARAKQTVAELEKSVDVMAKVAEQEGRYLEKGSPVIVEPSRDVVKEVEDEFGGTGTASPADKNL